MFEDGAQGAPSRRCLRPSPAATRRPLPSRKRWGQALSRRLDSRLRGNDGKGDVARGAPSGDAIGAECPAYAGMTVVGAGALLCVPLIIGARVIPAKAGTYSHAVIPA